MRAIATPETDTGPRLRDRERMCIATRQVRPLDEMIRFVVGPNAVVVPDVRRRLPGRGVWVDAQRLTLQDAVKHGTFQRGFRAAVNVPPDLAGTVADLLTRSVLDALAVARKAGQVISGFSNVEDAVARGAPKALFHAQEASSDGVRKIAAALARAFGVNAPSVPVISLFTSAQLDLALGRPNVVHAALLAGRASETVVARWRILERYQSGDRDAGAPSAIHQAPGLGSE